MIVHQMNYKRNTTIMKRDGIATPGWGYCYKCHTSWDHVESHRTPWWWVSNDRNEQGPVPLNESWTYSSGCFPLCKECWRELETPQARMVYYRMLWSSWLDEAHQNNRPIAEIVALVNKWPAIEAGVNAELLVDKEYNLRLGDCLLLRSSHPSPSVYCTYIGQFRFEFQHVDKSYGSISLARSRLRKEINAVRREDVMPYKDQVWSNDYTNTNVKVINVKELTIEIRTPQGFQYTYPLGQFRKEYTYVSN